MSPYFPPHTSVVKGRSVPATNLILKTKPFMANQERLKYLFQRYIDHTETPGELEELMLLIETGGYREEIELLLDAARPGLTHSARLDDEQSEQLFLAIRRQMEGDQVIKMTKVRRRRWVAAASIVLALAGGAYFWLQQREGQVPEASTVITSEDVQAPQTTKAMITLADGRTVSLDSIASGMLAQQADVTVTKTADGQIIYSGNTSEMAYNTLTNPKGSQVIDMKLADGSRVWLNAGSSVTFPISFSGNERKVTITGEAYFEVTTLRKPGEKSAFAPFIVQKDNVQVLVKGTHFNINAYDDESELKVTLLEGRVIVSTGEAAERQEAALEPGKQARYGKNGKIAVASDVDLDEVMAWKNGLFDFSSADIQVIMRQIGRWYDLEVSFEGAIPQREFSGKIARNTLLSNVLKILEQSNIHFRMEQNRIVVTR